MRAAIYARVSKERCPAKGCGHLKSVHEKGRGRCNHGSCKCGEYEGQDPEVQLNQLRRYAAAQEWEWVEFIDYETGKHANRAKFRELFEAAARREFNVVLVWALDRFSREGIAGTFEHLKKLFDHGVQFESFSEPYFRTTGPGGAAFTELLIAIFAFAARQERSRNSERTRAALERAIADGKKLGPPMKVFDRDRARRLRQSGMSWRKMEAELGVPQATLRNALKGVQ